MAFLDSVRLSVGTLTVIPVGAVPQVDPSVARTAMIIAPLAVAPLAVMAAGAGWLSHVVGMPGMINGLFAVAVLVLGTRALHVDGLADTVDGLGRGRRAEQALAVMRRGDIGPMGVTTLILVLVAQAAAAGWLLVSWSGAVQFAVLVCCSRAALVLVCRTGVPAARPDGLGAAVADTVPFGAALSIWLAVAAVVTLLAVWRDQAWWLGLLTAAAGALLVTTLVRHCLRRLGGVTGDVMGAAVEVAFTVLVVLALP